MFCRPYTWKVSWVHFQVGKGDLFKSRFADLEPNLMPANWQCELVHPYIGPYRAQTKMEIKARERGNRGERKRGGGDAEGREAGGGIDGGHWRDVEAFEAPSSSMRGD